MNPRIVITAATATIAALFSTATVVDKAPIVMEQLKPAPLYGDEVFVLARRGMGGKFTDHATWNFAADARALCGIRFEVESKSTNDVWSEWIFKKTHRAQRARLVVMVGTSLGGLRTTEHAERWKKDGGGQPVRLLLVDTVPWTGPIPSNVGKDHVVWRNRYASDLRIGLGGGRPKGTIADAQHDRARWLTHGVLIHSPQTRKEVAEEICRGITHPSKRPAAR
jgi:hypothetical protein